MANGDMKMCYEGRIFMMKPLDFYAMDEKWTLMHNEYPSKAQGDPVEYSQEAFTKIFGK